MQSAETGGTAPIPLRDIGGVGIAALCRDDAMALLHNAMAVPPGPENHGLKLAFCNAHGVNLAARDAMFRACLSQMLVLPDGIGVDIGARLLHGSAFQDNLNGTDFMPEVITSSRRPLRIALLGGREGVAEKAASWLSRLDARHETMVLGHGFFDVAGEAAMLERLAKTPVDLLLVALGNPGQEIWITHNIGPHHARVAAGVGALFDFWAGEVPRAPLWLRQLRLEWLFRLAQEPGRLWQRYVMGNPAFILRILRQRFFGR